MVARDIDTVGSAVRRGRVAFVEVYRQWPAYFLDSFMAIQAADVRAAGHDTAWLKGFLLEEASNCRAQKGSTTKVRPLLLMARRGGAEEAGREEAGRGGAAAQAAAASAIVIPDWIKLTAGWWNDDSISDSTFVVSLQWLITNGIMTIPPTEQGIGSGDVIPGWIKFNAGWWADGSIDDSTFVTGLQWLISNGIMVIG